MKLKLLWRLRKSFAERRLRKLMKKHPKKRNHAVELRIEQEIQRCELALEWINEINEKS